MLVKTFSTLLFKGLNPNDEHADKSTITLLDQMDKNVKEFLLTETSLGLRTKIVSQQDTRITDSPNQLMTSFLE